MKKVYLICMLAALSITSGFCSLVYQSNDTNNKDTLQIITSENLSGLLNSVIEEFKKSNSDIEFKVELTDRTSADLVSTRGNFLFTSDPAQGYSHPGKWSMTVCRDILVPVVSSSNPYLEQLMVRGIKPSEFASIFNSDNNTTWGYLIGDDGSERIRIFIDDRVSTSEQIKQFTGTDSELIKANSTVVRDNVDSEVNKSKFSIGFCRLTDIVGGDKIEFKDGVRVIPIDNNENGMVDHFENYQGMYSDLTRAVWIGKYPKSLYREIRLVAPLKPVDDVSKRFVETLLTYGQSVLIANGYTELITSERRSSLNELYTGEDVYTVKNQAYASVSRAFFWIIGIVLFIVVGTIILMLSSKVSSVPDKVNIDHKVLDRERISIPAGMLFDKSHTWSFMEQNGIVKVGAADFLQHITGKISKVIALHRGETIKKGDPMITILQDGKRLVLYSPVSGVIENVNLDLEKTGSKINSSPYGDGWIYEIKPSKWASEYRSFLIGDTYKEWLQNELLRLKEFLSSAVFRPQAPELKPLLQDGGEVIDNLLEFLGPDLWEEFQIGFIDRAL